ncbi:hypothetical protein CRE_27086 [Caenorhabditis remanei]|uniref:Uncharacterized protein n=1 Tax=Caenorhabditis remanei TaxID=31234 RepID=E3LQ53_CAERE|nr:hypothetical protein CRE_27086 [Caenorhabditis remanei]
MFLSSYSVQFSSLTPTKSFPFSRHPTSTIMKLISTLLKKFKKSSSMTSSQKLGSTSSESSGNIWSHSNLSTYDEKLKKYEIQQKKAEEVKEIRQERRTLRRQNRFLGFQNDVLTLQNQRLASEKHNLRVEKQEIAEKKSELARRLRKQRRVSEYYRRKLAEIQKLEKITI